MTLMEFQKAAIRRIRQEVMGFVIWLWRRQAGKTTNLAWLALRFMAENPGILVTFASASLLVGREMLLKEAHLFYQILEAWRTDAEEKQFKVESNIDGLKEDDFLEIFEAGKMEVKLWHDRTRYSRTKIIAPNPATARGYTGFVMIDEIGFIQMLKELYEAMEPIASRNPDFRVLMATTPPEDDGHYSYDLTAPEPETVFNHSASGNWYTSQAGIPVHRVDAWDADLAGVKLYDRLTRQPISPEDHRKQALDRDAWDRNYGLKFLRGGISAVSLQSLGSAMERGRTQCIFAEGDFPIEWQSLIGEGPVTVGLDPATTENERSNPTGLCIMERVGTEFIARLVLRFKTEDPYVSRAMIKEALQIRPGKRAKRLVIDATSERFFAAEIRREMSPICPVELVVSSEKTEYMGQEMSVKSYLGNLLVNAFDDNEMCVPDSRPLKDDIRSVVKNKGSFENIVDSSGNHGDCFDAMKLALHGLIRGYSGSAEAHAAGVGSLWVHQNYRSSTRPLIAV